jgi:hypothetical protein
MIKRLRIVVTRVRRVVWTHEISQPRMFCPTCGHEAAPVPIAAGQRNPIVRAPARKRSDESRR